MPDEREQRLDPILERMLGIVPRARYRVCGIQHARQIVIAGMTVSLDPAAHAFEFQLERLASAIEASLAYARANAMLVAAGAQNGRVPLWLVTGSSALARWLAWSRSEAAFRKTLVLSDEASAAPVAGKFERSARTALGQTAVKIRVRNALAVAERIELSSTRQHTMTFGQTARLTISCGQLPDTIIASFAGRSLSEIAAHPFFTAANLIVTTARIDGGKLVIEIDHEWGPLAPVPEAAMAVVPADADPVYPWRPTKREIGDLYAMVDALRRHGRTA